MSDADGDVVLAFNGSFPPIAATRLRSKLGCRDREGGFVMYVFWWSGRGYYTVLVVLGVLTAFGLLAAVGIPDGPWFWAVALLAAAALNWQVGSMTNRKKLAALKPRSLKSRLFYRAHHRFMSLPMETFSLVLIAGSVGWLLYRLSSVA